MQRLTVTAFFGLVFCVSAFPQDRGIIRCQAGMDRIPAWSAPGRPHVVEQLSCDQMVSIVGLERGYVKIQIGEKTAYVDARYVRVSDVPRQSPAQPGAAFEDREARPEPVLPKGAPAGAYPRVDVFAGYSMLRPNLPGDLIPGDAAGSALAEEAGEFILGNIVGWGADLTVHLNRYFGVTADFSGFYKGFDAAFEGVSADLSGNLHTFMFGPAFTFRSGKVNPFVRVLFGVGRASADVEVEAEGERVQAEVSKNGLAASVGGGVDIKINDRVSMRAIQMDYLPYRQGNGKVFTFNNIRWASGLVFHF